VTLLLVERDALIAAQAACVTRSECAERTLGVAAVAEGCALAAAGQGARLVLPRIASARATCALAGVALTPTLSRTRERVARSAG
jgi:cobalamin biosynthesis protein CbiG